MSGAQHYPDVAEKRLLISICLCTYRRPELLANLLNLLDRQITDDQFRIAIAVVDNDELASAQGVVTEFANLHHTPIAYRVESIQNIAIARNTSLMMASGELIAIIDDDEEPANDWLLQLYRTLLAFQADGVLGPVNPKFEVDAPSWAVRGQVFQRPNFKTGSVIPWSATGTGNVLMKREVALEAGPTFDLNLGAGGEDVDFFRRAMERNRVFVWCAEAICMERIPPTRTRIKFQLRRALLRGKIASRTTGWMGILKSLAAILLYSLLLPFCWLKGSHQFVTYLVRSFDHLGKLLGFCGVDLVGEKYITS